MTLKSDVKFEEKIKKSHEVSGEFSPNYEKV